MIRALIITLVLVASVLAGNFSFSNTTVIFYPKTNGPTLYGVVAKWAAKEQPSCDVSFENGYIIAANCTLPSVRTDIAFVLINQVLTLS